MSAPVSPVASGPTEPEDVRSRSLLRPAILLLLREQESHGYELMGRLAELGVEVPPTTGGLYRSLRTMAEEGLVSSYWSTPDRGPARRVYAITEAGEHHLEMSMPSLASLLRTVRGMLNRYRQGG
ncbi:MAG: PadR family transcriptional regulator [Acidimicrobiales bacterium]